MLFFTIENVKSKEVYTVNEEEVLRYFNCDSFSDENILKDEFEQTLNDVFDTEEEQLEFIAYWNEDFKNIISDKKTYLTKMVEYVDYCSPNGVCPLYKVIEVK